MHLSGKKRSFGVVSRSVFPFFVVLSFCSLFCFHFFPLSYSIFLFIPFFPCFIIYIALFYRFLFLCFIIFISLVSSFSPLFYSIFSSFFPCFIVFPCYIVLPYFIIFPRFFLFSSFLFPCLTAKICVTE